MASRRLTTSNLVAEVRSMLDEQNREAVDDVTDIIPALNRAQDHAANILARHYESPLLAYTSVTLTGGTSEYDVPEDAFEQRLEKIEVNVNGRYSEVRRISYRDATPYDTNSSTSFPAFYSVVGQKYRLMPTPSGTYPLRVWYLKDPDALVLEQGRITGISIGSRYVTVDSIGEDLTTEADQLDSYVNLIDGQTGLIKATLQIQNIQGNKVYFKSSPARSTVLNRTISSSIPTTVEKDDFLCTIHGTCVPLLKKPFSNYLIEYAVAELQRKLGGPADLELRVLESMEAAVERSWVGREQALRISKRSQNWGSSIRRYNLNNG
jgi:hypothetical protein